jgi:hypothetical protein
MPPILDLSDTTPGRAYIRLLALMYAPNDPERRQRFESSMYAKAVIEAARPLACEPSVDLLGKGIDPRRLMKMLTDAAQAPGLSDVQREMADAGLRGDNLIRGANAGCILGGVLQSRGTIESVVAAMSRIARENGLRFMSEASLRKDWLAFRHLSHIWLGHLMTVGAPQRFVSREELLEIFGRADDYRRQGEAHTIGQKALHLLDRASTWRVKLPDGVVLPKPASRLCYG